MLQVAIVLVGLLATAPLLPHSADDEQTVTLTAQLANDAVVSPGKSVELEIVAVVTDTPDSKGKRWHIYPRKEQHRGPENATVITAKSESTDLKIGAVSWPAPKIFRNALGQLQPVYEGRVVFTVPVEIAADAAPGDHTITIDFAYQTCASLCLPPATIPLSVTLVIPGAATSPDQPPAPVAPPADAAETSRPLEEPATQRTSTPDDTTTAPTKSSARREDFETSLFGSKFGFSGSSTFSLPLLLLFAALGGFLLNLTPCVLPIIPIKIVGLTQSTSGDSRRMKMLGLAMGFGILAFWLAIGAAISFVSGFNSISALFQRPVFGIAVGLFIGVMGISMLVDLAVQLPQAVYKFNPGHDTLAGAFGFGVMTAVLSTPCTAPFMGSAAAWATRAGSPSLILAVFASIAVGMGWPYVMLTWHPGWLKRVPRTGPASVLVKQSMGLLMLGVASFFAGTGLLGLIRERPHLGPVLHWWLATAFVGMTAIWLSVQTFRITRSTLKRSFWTATGLLMFAAMVAWSRGETADSLESTNLKLAEQRALEQYARDLEARLQNGRNDELPPVLPVAWREYSSAALASAKARGQVAVVHFTADW